MEPFLETQGAMTEEAFVDFYPQYAVCGRLCKKFRLG